MLSPTKANQLQVLRMVAAEDLAIPIPLGDALKVLVQARHILIGPSGEHLSQSGRILLDAYTD